MSQPRREIEILMKSGKRKKIHAHVIGDWAWHMSPEGGGDAGKDWSVTHVPSGRSLPAHTVRQIDIAALAAALDIGVPQGADVDVIRELWPGILASWITRRRLRTAVYANDVYVPQAF